MISRVVVKFSEVTGLQPKHTTNKGPLVQIDSRFRVSLVSKSLPRSEPSVINFAKYITS